MYSIYRRIQSWLITEQVLSSLDRETARCARNAAAAVSAYTVAGLSISIVFLFSGVYLGASLAFIVVLGGIFSILLIRWGKQFAGRILAVSFPQTILILLVLTNPIETRLQFGFLVCPALAITVLTTREVIPKLLIIFQGLACFYALDIIYPMIDPKWITPVPEGSLYAVQFVITLAIFFLILQPLNQAIYYANRNENALIHEKVKVAQSEKLASVAFLAGGVAHEVNNPLSIISMSVSQIREITDKATERSRIYKLLDRADRMVKRIADIVQGLLIISNQKIVQSISNEPIFKTVHRALSFVEKRLAEGGVTVDTSQVSRSLDIHSGISEISHALLAIITNSIEAIEHMPERTIRIATDFRESKVRILVEDSGPGVPPDLHLKIFDPFFSTKPVGAGTGLGLSTAKSLVHALGGDVYIDPDRQHTRFVIECPPAPVSEELNLKSA